MRRFFLFLCIIHSFAAPCLAGETLNDVKARGMVRCGVSNNSPGFAVKDENGRWSGMDVDYCRAVAAAVLGDPEKVRYVPLEPLARFSSLLAKEIDVLSRNTTWTLGREAAFRVSFVGVYFFSEQGILVAAKQVDAGLAGLSGKAVCVVKGTTHVASLPQISELYNIDIKPLPFDSVDLAERAFLAGECQGLIGDLPVLAIIRNRKRGTPEECSILPERFSKEPISPVARQDDQLWLLILRGVLGALITAEECGFSQADAIAGVEKGSNVAARQFLKRADDMAKAIEIGPGWAARAVAAVGNYGEVFERNLGAGSPFKFQRRLTRLWNQGGLMYSPPF